MDIVPFIVGPTCSGKTALSVKISEKLPIEIVSADSRQLYKFLDIGTAKPSNAILKKIPHHFINFLRPDEYFSAGAFCRIGRNIIKQIFDRGNIPLVVGGSGLYVKSIIDGFFELEVRDEKVRTSLRQRLINEGIGKLYKEVKQIDPAIAKKLEKNDTQRILRALEVYLSTGKKLSELQETGTKPADFTPLIFGLSLDREFLYRRINERVDQMIDDGLLAEVANLRVSGFSADFNSLNTVGYREVFDYLNNLITYDRTIELIKQNSRRYAKRQMTWFRKEKRIVWIIIDEDTNLEIVADQMVADYNNMKLRQ